MIYTFKEPTEADYRVAQNILDDHVMLSRSGRCRVCDVEGPCPRRESAAILFSRWLWLPARRPGASQPALVGARRVY